MNVLALEPYFGGSHRAFLDGWRAHSRHSWSLLTLPPFKWKWRMRHAAIHFADEVARRSAAGETWDVLFCSDMLNLAEFRGLAPASVRELPSVAYFHENQLTYPAQHEDERDYHFVLTNLTTALAATTVWFNSAFHRDEFVGALPTFLKRMPDFVPLDSVARVAAKAEVQHPGIEELPPRGPRRAGPLRILWAARWEHDKNPEDFFGALELLEQGRVEFRVSVIGEQFRDSPAIFAHAKERFARQINRWGFQPTRSDYVAALAAADVFVSTANHEFFGISAAEAISAGALPLLPRRLSYPELLGDADGTNRYFYDGSVPTLAAALERTSELLAAPDAWTAALRPARESISGCFWERRAPAMDVALEAAARGD